MSLHQARHWVFDMDGTLTLAVHDFEAIKHALEIPLEQDILHHLAALPADEAKAKHAWLLEHERELALNARPAPGAVELLRELAGRGYQLGILTRNAHELALLTLQAIGVGDCFAAADVIGRDEALPKPDPDGLLHLAQRWQVAPSQLIMVGDYRFDLQCARAAGAYSVLVNLPSNPWPELVDHFALDCGALLGQLDGRSN
ncbi:HAD family hydrolase [Pseudomonas segetis]|uniref:Haloacid dehalogenase superfamily, subfamily IA, variant 3 with third motif having DD or ED/haloacid dehalogenase superfamily, subfamily IA, variant 1 with third motif having Dx(3-4)D or Dx(3-4)E n=1 Tax=Pseudomonas segetis TaxID=298908 RepID=A0A239GZA2_9PSED|nr:HAD family hydrolase [Pseudomonas segetis]SNS74195.1 haloacid dehalogenase superfamily, subfamily IA, variant 3 with third motif having DD or ED/haloacid dehalogenase superfamily, subfamily IA, variant 1 with third motif having Dx(3-4)D or Dx(3-4)E [Pseudomonas segetis]